MKGIAKYFSAVFALAILLTVQAAKADTTYNFQTLNNNTDPTFNQLLGVNNAGEIAGYFAKRGNRSSE